MVTPPVGAVVLVPFPFSHLSRSKLRPAVALADAGRGDWVLCQVTSNPYADTRAVAISDDDLQQGQLHRISYARPGRLFTANHELMVRQVGVLRADMHRQIIDAVVELLRDALRV